LAARIPYISRCKNTLWPKIDLVSSILSESGVGAKRSVMNL
jgi:hypothetical protein